MQTRRLHSYASGATPRVGILVTEDGRGRSQFEEFFRSLEIRDQHLLTGRFQIVAQGGWDWLRQNSRSIGPNLYELRQPRHLRVFWTQYGQSAIVILGGVHKGAGSSEQSRAIQKARRVSVALRFGRG